MKNTSRYLLFFVLFVAILCLFVACSDFEEEITDEPDETTTADPALTTTVDPAATTTERAPLWTLKPVTGITVTLSPVTVPLPVTMRPVTVRPVTMPIPVTTTKAPITTTAPVTTAPIDAVLTGTYVDAEGSTSVVFSGNFLKVINEETLVYVYELNPEMTEISVIFEENYLREYLAEKFGDRYDEETFDSIVATFMEDSVETVSFEMGDDAVRIANTWYYRPGAVPPVTAAPVTTALPITSVPVTTTVPVTTGPAYVRDGEYIYFGEWPQTVKASDVTVSDVTDERGYYLGSDGAYYAKVKANPNGSCVFSTGEAVVSGLVYYFKVEPIRWKIVSEADGEALLLCDSIIDARSFGGSSNDYMSSSIRKWLNGSFYEAAFGQSERELILASVVDGSTEENVVLLSLGEVEGLSYTDRRKATSDYSRAFGAFTSTSGDYVGNGWWWTRTAWPGASIYVRHVWCSGTANYSTDYSNVSSDHGGVVPALRFDLSNDRELTTLVTFDPANGETATTKRVSLGYKLLPIAPPSNNAYLLDGWKVNGEYWDFENDIVTGPMTLVATWVQDSEKSYLTEKELTQAYFDLDPVVYKGGSIAKNSYTITDCPQPCNAIYTFRMVDEDGNLIRELGETVPSEVGLYEVTATFEFKTSRKYQAYHGTPLPKPITATLEIVPAAAKGFGVQDITIYAYDGMNYLPDATAFEGKNNIHTGILPGGVGVKEYRITDADQNPVATITGEGVYTVEVVYWQEGNNWTEASLASKTATITVKAIADDKQVKRHDGVVVDGLLDDAYLNSAKYTGVYQGKGEATNNLEFVFDGEVVDPMTNIALYYISKGVGLDANFDIGVEVDVYVLWGTPAGSDIPWIYVAVVVEDQTDYQRSALYTAQRNPWINDGIELYYNFGGYETPIFAKRSSTSWADTYPTYKAVTNNSAARDGEAFTASRAQQSVFYDRIEFASTREETVPGANEGLPVTYISEYAFPAQAESYAGIPGNQYIQVEGDVLTAGELLFFGIQVNDLTYLEPGYDDNVPTGAKYADDYTFALEGDWVDFEKNAQEYVCAVGNRQPAYLMSEQGGPMIFQLSDEYAE